MRTRGIKELIVLGDSLSDPGNMKHRLLLGLFPVPATGLDKSGDGSFTDSLVWPDYLIMHRLQIALRQACDKLIEHRGETKKLASVLVNNYILGVGAYLESHGNNVHLLHHELCRNYAEGGATAATMSPIISVTTDLVTAAEHPTSIIESAETLVHPEKLFHEVTAEGASLGAQFIVTNLEAQRHRLLHDSATLSSRQKDAVLIVEWSGANDLITVHTHITKSSVDTAVAARINNVKKLYDAGFRNFVLFNLPDLSKTPQYQNRSTKEQKKVKYFVRYFNQQLKMKLSLFLSNPAQYSDNQKSVYCPKLLSCCYPSKQKVHTPNTKTKCNGFIFDAYNHFNDIYSHPKMYHFDPEKLKSTLITDRDFAPHLAINGNSLGYMFWNGVHPVSVVHRLLADRFMAFIQQKGFGFQDSELALKIANQLLTDHKANRALAGNLNALFSPSTHGNIQTKPKVSHKSLDGFSRVSLV